MMDGMDLIDLQRATVRRAMAVSDVKIEKGDGRTVTAYATPFDSENFITDEHGRYYERIARTAFTKSLKEGIGRMLVLFNHGRDLHGRTVPELLVPIGKSLDVRPDGRGIITRTRYFDHPLSESILDGIRSGALTSYSHESGILRSRRVGSREGLPVFEHMEMRMHEYGPTPLPHVLEGAEILTVRSVGLADQIAGLDVEALDSATRAELAAILGRAGTSDSTPPGEGTSGLTPPEPDAQSGLQLPTPPGEGTSDDEDVEAIKAADAALVRLRAQLEARKRRV